MHMADALISPVVGGAMTIASAGLIGYSIKKLKRDLDEKRIPLMGVMGAFIFAAQMINFTIPATGSSGHLGGGLLLAAILGPHAAFLTIASVLMIQALFFADGGLMALGCNIFNMGFYPCFLAYPLIYQLFVKKAMNRKQIFWGSLIGVVVALQLGAFSVVLQTLLSGKTELPFAAFALLMQPIHLAIGTVEGLVTASVISFIYAANPDIVSSVINRQHLHTKSIKKVVVGLLLLTAFTGGVLSLAASEYPDGLEWALIGVAGEAELEAGGAVYQALADVQEKIAFLPDYGFQDQSETEGAIGTSVSGIIGGVLTLLLVAVIGKFVAVMKKKTVGVKP